MILGAIICGGTTLYLVTVIVVNLWLPDAEKEKVQRGWFTG